ncbi:2800_t:CDS:2 [Paraglomus occultum]|uniref:2800_t:CDS:1 n=1 Tax=Paraglomus occultum TaxID=144539 RepID=A0A9N8WGA9_9GLOM|nr:2800_t:CDS:2 [Paraglomus occultum]
MIEEEICADNAPIHSSHPCPTSGRLETLATEYGPSLTPPTRSLTDPIIAGEAFVNKIMPNLGYAIKDFKCNPERTLLCEKPISNELIVEDTIRDDNSLMILSPAAMKKLRLYCGATALIEGRKGYNTILIVWADEGCEDVKVRINQVVRTNLRVRLGDVVSIQLFSDIKDGRRVQLLPIDNTVEGVMGDFFEPHLKQYFQNTYRPVREGDVFSIKYGGLSMKFKVLETDPPNYCYERYTDML